MASTLKVRVSLGTNWLKEVEAERRELARRGYVGQLHVDLAGSIQHVEAERRRLKQQQAVLF